MSWFQMQNFLNSSNMIKSLCALGLSSAVNYLCTLEDSKHQSNIGTIRCFLCEASLKMAKHEAGCCRQAWTMHCVRLPWTATYEGTWLLEVAVGQEFLPSVTRTLLECFCWERKIQMNESWLFPRAVILQHELQAAKPFHHAHLAEPKQ